jgi:non-ribosomal peptide synthetase component F
MVQFDLVMNLTDTDQGLVGAFEYSTDLFDPSTIHRMLKHFEILLQSVIARPQSRLSEIALVLVEADWQQQRSEESELEQARLKSLRTGKRRRVAEI